MELRKRIEIFSEIIASTICNDIQGKILHIEHGIMATLDILMGSLERKSMLYLIGNGGSAAVASHSQIDFLNVGKLRAQVLHEPSALTCMSNDYGYENAYDRLLDIMLNPDDVLIAISSSGRSENICKAAKRAKSRGAMVITFSGFKPDNPLRKIGDLNYWLDSTDYGFVEIGHQFILHNLSDRFAMIEKQFSAMEKQYA